MPVVDCFVSVVAPLRNDAAIVAGFVDDVIGVLRANFTNYEIVLVDDGSEDETPTLVDSLLQRVECVRFLRLSRDFGEEIAITAGLDTVIGDFAVIMLPNYDPPALIPEFVKRARLGAGVVFGIRQSRPGETIFMRAGAAVWYWYSTRFLRLSIPRDSSQFRLLTRQAVNAVVRIRNKYRYLRTLSADVGFAAAGLEYEPIVRNPRRPPRSFWERVAVSVDIVVASSPHPIRVVTGAGLGVSALTLITTLFLVWRSDLGGQLPGALTVFSILLVMLFVLLFAVLALLGEYVGHVLVESQDRPLYYVISERNSQIDLVDPSRRNIVMTSVTDRV